MWRIGISNALFPWPLGAPLAPAVSDKTSSVNKQSATTGHGDGAVVCRERLGGMLKHYYREAA